MDTELVVPVAAPMRAPPNRSVTGRSSLDVAVRALYLPSVLLGLATLALVSRGLVVLGRTGGLASALLTGENQLAGPVVVGVVLLVAVCERVSPAVRRPLTARGQLHDACYLLAFAAVVVPFVTILGYGVSSALTTWAPWLVLRAGALPAWLAVGAALVLMDGCNWLVHLGDHKLAPLWRVHAVHHSQEELSVLTTFRTHPLAHTTSSLLATVPVVALTGQHPVTPVLITGYLVLGALPHANLRWSYGPLGALFVSPAYHRLHHRVEGPDDVNLAIVLPLFDVLAGRAVFPARRAEPCATGIAGRPLRVEQSSGHYRPLALLADQLVEPFRAPRRQT
jgi:sterol desaturase/sphingolipid hydroxylase (fatty acid hydroxylase superfamily)